MWIDVEYLLKTLLFFTILFCYLWVVVKAFKTSFGWGIVCLMTGFIIGPSLYAIEYFREVKIALLAIYAGSILFILLAI